jgi:DNA-binding NarL/FixJ family response regulator
MIHVLLVDDHPVVRTGYARLLEQTGEMQVVAEADSAEQAIEHWINGPVPDVVVTDLSMPGMGGLELIRRLLARAPEARVLVFSMHDSDALVQRALEAGALGFVAKSAPPQVLVDAVREVAAGRRTWHADAAASDGPSRGSAGLAGDQARLASLTEREFALFRLLAQGHPLAECAVLLGVSSKTASNYQTLIREKLGVSTSAALVHLAMRCGAIDSAGG